MRPDLPATPLPLYTVIRNTSSGWPSLVECTACGKRFKREAGFKVLELDSIFFAHRCKNVAADW